MPECWLWHQRPRGTRQQRSRHGRQRAPRSSRQPTLYQHEVRVVAFRCVYFVLCVELQARRGEKGSKDAGVDVGDRSIQQRHAVLRCREMRLGDCVRRDRQRHCNVGTDADQRSNGVAVTAFCGQSQRRVPVLTNTQASSFHSIIKSYRTSLMALTSTLELARRRERMPRNPRAAASCNGDVPV